MVEPPEDRGRFKILTTAILDRLLHHVHVVNIDGRSYRLREIGDLLQGPTSNRNPTPGKEASSPCSRARVRKSSYLQAAQKFVSLYSIIRDSRYWAGWSNRSGQSIANGSRRVVSDSTTGSPGSCAGVDSPGSRRSSCRKPALTRVHPVTGYEEQGERVRLPRLASPRKNSVPCPFLEGVRLNHPDLDQGSSSLSFRDRPQPTCLLGGAGVSTQRPSQE